MSILFYSNRNSKSKQSGSKNQKERNKRRNAKNRNPSLDARCNNGFSFYSSATNRKLYPTHVRDSGWTEKREDRRPFVRCLQLVVKPTNSIINQITFRYETPAVYRPKRAEFSPLSLPSTLLFNRRQTFTVKAIESRSYVACSTEKNIPLWNSIRISTWYTLNVSRRSRKQLSVSWIGRYEKLNGTTRSYSANESLE